MYNILIVDDEYFERQALKMMLEEMKEVGNILEAENGLSALHFMETESIDLIFMDIKMPKMDGIEACRQIRLQNQDVVIVFLTAFADFEYAREAIRNHANDYLLKPSRPEKVEETLKLIQSKPSIKLENPMETFKKAIMKGQVRDSKEALTALLSRNTSHDEEVETMKGVLIILLEVSEYYNITLDKKSSSELQVMAQKNLRVKEGAEFIEIILNKIFEKMILKKISQYEHEIEHALNYIEFYLSKPFSLEDVAEYMNISPHYFSKLFKNEVGENFIHYVTRRKIEIACEKLAKTEVPIISIAFDLGFNEANYFSKVFKKQVGMSPNEYRKIEQEKIAEANKLMGRYHSSKWII